MTENNAKIQKLSHDGRGIAQVNGKTTFIAGALPDELVKFKYTKNSGSYNEGQATEIIEPALLRENPKCPHADICGGCSLQHINHELQLQLKQDALLDMLRRFGKTEPKTLLPPITGPIWGYRLKARLGAKYVIKKSKQLVGFREKNSRFLADINNCEILHPIIGKKINELASLIASLETNKDIPQVEVSIDDHDCALVFRHLRELPIPDIEKLIEFGEKHKFLIYLQPKGPNSIHLLHPKKHDTLSYRLTRYNIEVNFNPNDFTQINQHINQQMVTSAINLLELKSNENCLDLFCGLGNFSLPLALNCKHVTAVEGDAEMVARAKQNAEKNMIANVDFHCANLFENCSHHAWYAQTYAKMLLDPPRSGAQYLAEQIARFKAKKIVYISCNPATLARDSGEITRQNYQMTYAGIMDMFPHTKHIEAIAVFEQK